ncbi:MAG: nucleotide-binding protein [Deltaproteobacteria bacterium]|nr:nucleotide-binding protein [Deltaproteobacteria bacterium]
MPEPSASTAKEKVFVVHGHDTTSKEQLELILHKLGLDPFVLANTGGGGLTIIEALEREIGDKEGQAKFGIVLLTPDDMGYAKDSGAENAEPRARQNVVLEMGMLLSAIGRSNVTILKKGHLEPPSDAQGILYIPYNDHVKEVVPRLVDRLTSAGFILDPSSITRASS